MGAANLNLFNSSADGYARLAETLGKYGLGLYFMRSVEWAIFLIGGLSTLLAMASILNSLAVRFFATMSETSNQKMIKAQATYEGISGALLDFDIWLAFAPLIIILSVFLGVLLVKMHASLEETGDNRLLDLVTDLRLVAKNSGQNTLKDIVETRIIDWPLLKLNISEIIILYRRTATPLFYSGSNLSIKSVALLLGCVAIGVIDLFLS